MLLASDMAAFKAANPGAALEDFVRWRSPADWAGGQLSERVAAPVRAAAAGGSVVVTKVLWDAVSGRHEGKCAAMMMVARGGKAVALLTSPNRAMSRAFNSPLLCRLQASVWQQLWAATAPAPAAAQRPLFDPVLEGERALHFLETIPPALLFGDLLAVGLSAAAGLLGKAEAAGLPAVGAELER